MFPGLAIRGQQAEIRSPKLRFEFDDSFVNLV